jgi:hypothetical protein
MKRSIVLALAALSGGLAIYLLLRIPGWHHKSIVLSWLVYSLPDGLWAFAYALLISSIWANSRTRVRSFWLASIPVPVLGFELAQKSGMIPGTYDPVDLIFCSVGIVAGILAGKLKS